ncbi:MAG: ATP-binding protein, partial [Kiritimatiellia bacterium]
DNGGGVPADILPKVFDPYFTTKEQGSGIGLYMVKMIVEKNMGGHVEAANVADGARFVVRIPLKKPE